MLIRFTRREVYQCFGPGHPDNPVYEADSEHNMRPDLAERWIKRGAAELVTPPSLSRARDHQPAAGGDPPAVDPLTRDPPAPAGEEAASASRQRKR